jgi:stage II sporulation protein D
VAAVDLWPGDRIRYRTDDRGAIDFLELQPPVKGAADDRSAKVYSWEVRRSRREVEQAAARFVSIGPLVDLRPLRRGVSGRIVELELVGRSGSAVVRGFDVRRVLDLRESLVVIEVQRGADEAIDSVIFAGKGWGHGVGLCQVGAYGMAQRGAGYAEILRHYYTGVQLAQIPGPEPVPEVR